MGGRGGGGREGVVGSSRGERVQAGVIGRLNVRRGRDAGRREGGRSGDAIRCTLISFICEQFVNIFVCEAALQPLSAATRPSVPLSVYVFIVILNTY